MKVDKANIKIRTNDSFENYNRRFKYNFKYKKEINILNFIDILVDEVQNQETYLIDENRKPLATISELN